MCDEHETVPVSLVGPLIKALDQLRQGLIEARRLHLTETEGVRAGIIRSLQSLIAFIQSIPQWQREQLDAPLTMLLVSLEGLQSGQIDPVLRFDPGGYGSRRPDNLDRVYVQARAAAAVDWLINTGLKMTDAAEKVGVTLQKGGMKLGIDDRPPRITVLGWRKGCQRKAADDERSRYYRELLETGHTFGQLPDAELRLRILDSLQHLARAFARE
jgi:hypothetical protein